MGAKTAAPQVAPLCARESVDVRHLALRFLDKFDCSEHAEVVASCTTTRTSR